MVVVACPCSPSFHRTCGCGSAAVGGVAYTAGSSSTGFHRSPPCCAAWSAPAAAASCRSRGTTALSHQTFAWSFAPPSVRPPVVELGSVDRRGVLVVRSLPANRLSLAHGCKRARAATAQSPPAHGTAAAVDLEPKGANHTERRGPFRQHVAPYRASSRPRRHVNEGDQLLRSLCSLDPGRVVDVLRATDCPSGQWAHCGMRLFAAHTPKMKFNCLAE